jgi:hypothetical protein
MNEGTEFWYYKLKILIDNLIFNLIYLSINRGIKRDFHIVGSKIQYPLYKRLTSSYHELLYDLFNIRYHILIRLDLYTKIIEEVLSGLRGSYGELDHYETGDLD